MTLPTITIEAPKHQINVEKDYSVVFINVTNGGSGYNVAPTVTISDPIDENGFSLHGSNGYSRADASAVITNGVVTGITITNYGNGYLNNPTVTITTTSGNTGTGATADASIYFGFGATAVVSALIPFTGKLNASIFDGSGATAQAVTKVTPVIAKKYSWQLDNPIEVNENALIQVVDRVFEDIPTLKENIPIAIRMYDIGTQSIVNTQNLSRNNKSFNTGKIIDIGIANRIIPNDIKLEIQPQVIDRISLGLNFGISAEDGISARIEFLITLKVTEQEPNMLEFGSLNNLNINQF